MGDHNKLHLIVLKRKYTLKLIHRLILTRTSHLEMLSNKKITPSENDQIFLCFCRRVKRMKDKKDVFYEALMARDHRFDGKFFVAVKTTGIYCRPICPAKPKRENVEFFKHSWEAENKGYRPCLRCRPESAPQSPAWVGTSAVVRRAVRVLHSPESLKFDEDQFASLFGVSARHLRRLFIHEIGKTPKQLAFESRLNLARKLITETKLSMTEVAMAAGFHSIRRFNCAFKKRFKKTPTSIRRSQNIPHENLTLSLPYRPPFDFTGLLASYRSHRVGNLEWFTEGKMHRVIAMKDQVGQITISDDPTQCSLIIEIDFPSLTALPMVVSRVRAMFDLDSDPVLIANSLETNPHIKKLLRKHPGIRLPSGWDGFELAIATILGQLVSVERGQALVRDLIELTGKESGFHHEGKNIRLFPTPQDLMSADLTLLKTTKIRKQTLIDFSKAIVLGTLSLETTQDVEQFIHKVRRIKGIGPWTAQYMALKVLRSTDAFPASDLILARALEKHRPMKMENMSPWRGYLAALFWKDYAESKKLLPLAV